MMSATNETLSMDADAIQRFNDIAFCIQFGIVIVGCATTPLIPLFLWKVNIGSKLINLERNLKNGISMFAAVKTNSPFTHIQ